MQVLRGSASVPTHHTTRRAFTRRHLCVLSAWGGEISQKLAWSRSRESLHPSPLFVDQYSAALAAAEPPDEEKAVSMKPRLDPETSVVGCPPHVTNEYLEAQCALDAICTKYMDEAILNALGATNVNTINSGDYRQVVLVGDAYDTRPYRLPWPSNTIVFLVASKRVQEVAHSVLKQQGAKMPPACLLRRVNLDLEDLSRLPEDLQQAGFQPSKLSLWLLQGLQENSPITDLLVEVTSLAAFNSLILGELPVRSRRDAGNKIAEVGLLGSLLDPCGDLGRIYGRWPPVAFAASKSLEAEQQEADEGDDSEVTAAGRWIFTSQVKQLSNEQMDTYDAHLAMAESIDEDYNDNIS